jgi:hypothetical protein
MPPSARLPRPSATAADPGPGPGRGAPQRGVPSSRGSLAVLFLFLDENHSEGLGFGLFLLSRRRYHSLILDCGTLCTRYERPASPRRIARGSDSSRKSGWPIRTTSARTKFRSSAVSASISTTASSTRDTLRCAGGAADSALVSVCARTESGSVSPLDIARGGSCVIVGVPTGDKAALISSSVFDRSSASISFPC